VVSIETSLDYSQVPHVQTTSDAVVLDSIPHEREHDGTMVAERVDVRDLWCALPRAQPPATSHLSTMMSNKTIKIRRSIMTRS